MKDFQIFIKSVLRGFGQIMLQSNSWTGLLFLAAICYDSIWMGVAALASNLIGVLTAKVLKFDETRVQDGLYGFNATLTGVALVFFFQFNGWVAAAIVVGSVLSTILMEFALRKKLPAFTFPFILITWIAVFILKTSNSALPAVPDDFVENGLQDFWREGHAFGQVIFQGSIIAGLIFMIGVYINSPISALYGVMAAILSVAISRCGHEPTDMINAGIFSFNAVLCSIACAGTRPRDGIYVLLSIVLSTLIDMLMIHAGCMTLTFPFVLAMWIILIIKKVIPQPALAKEQ